MCGSGDVSTHVTRLNCLQFLICVNCLTIERVVAPKCLIKVLTRAINVVTSKKQNVLIDGLSRLFAIGMKFCVEFDFKFVV